MKNIPFSLRSIPISSIEFPLTTEELMIGGSGPGRLIAKIGLRTPPTVMVISEGPLKARIVTGVHRIRALRMLNVAEVGCLTLTSELEARLWNCSENLDRAELSAQERAEATASWLADVAKMIPAQVAQVSGGRGNRGGVSEIARAAGIERTGAARATAIAAIAPQAKLTRALQLDDNQQALLEIARADGPDEQVRKAKELAQKAKKSGSNPAQEFAALNRLGSGRGPASKSALLPTS